MPSEFHITSHAIEQFIRRWRNDKTFQEAEEELEALLRTSKAYGKTITGDQIYISGHLPTVRMVVKDRNVCVTVLPVAPSQAEDNFEELLREETEYLERAQTKHRESIQDEINVIEAELFHIDEERRKLGLKKNELVSEIQALKSKLKKI